MGLTYKNSELAGVDKAELEKLMIALAVSDSTLRRNEDGLWVLRGSRGYVSTWGDGASWALTFTDEVSPLQWTWHKKRLAFCTVTQDGDIDGVLRLARLPGASEAAAIREVFGLRKKADLSNEELERRRASGRALRSGYGAGSAGAFS
jgi:hypothetical protein